jgi:hypothetical protein
MSVECLFSISPTQEEQEEQEIQCRSSAYY